MRKFLGVALESGYAPTSYGQMSMEEEDMMLADAASGIVEIGADLGEVERIEGTADAMSDMADVVDTIPEVSQTDVQLINTVAAMGVAGTETQPGELLGEPTQTNDGIAFESYVGRRISTEGFRDTARKIWSTIKEFLKKIWAKIEKFFYSIFGGIPRMRAQIKALEKKIQESHSSRIKTDGKKISISSGVATLSVNYVPCATGDKLQSALKEFAGVAKQAMTDHHDEVVKLGDAYIKMIDGFDQKNYEAHIRSASMQAGGVLKKIASAVGPASAAKNGFVEHNSADLLGNKKIQFKIADNVSGGSAAPLERLHGMSQSGGSLVDSSEKHKEGKDSFEMTTLTQSQMNSVLSECTDLLDVLESYSRGKRRTEGQKTKDQMIKASERAEKEITSLKNDEEATERAMAPYYEGLVRLNRMFTQSVINPVGQIANLSTTVVRTSLVVVQKSLSCYE